jgi:two-component system chemotaxis response regulator CheB
MPRAVADAGLADEVLPLDELAAAIVREAGQ